MEMHKDINNLDPEDIGLKMIMGERFHDETTEKPKAAKITRKAEPTAKAENPAKAVKAPAIEPKHSPDAPDAQCIPAKPEPNFFDRLKACATWSICGGGLSLLLFYWQQTGQMLPSAAVPSLYVCAFLTGWGICKTAARKGA